MKYSITLALLALTAAFSGAPRPAAAAEDYAAYFQSECVDCHHLKKKPIEDKHLTRQEWQDAVEKMIQLDKLDPLPSKTFIAGFVDWLVRTHGPASK